jgi:hypothetical protein
MPSSGEVSAFFHANTDLNFNKYPNRFPAATHHGRLSRVHDGLARRVSGTDQGPPAEGATGGQERRFSTPTDHGIAGRPAARSQRARERCARYASDVVREFQLLGFSLQSLPPILC